MTSQHSIEEGMGPWERGRHRYKQKDFRGALKAFNEAVIASSTDNMLHTALDSRAAAYEKLEQFRPAHRDGTAMIELKPYSSKGYLRTGKVLQLQGKESSALQIYAKGLTKVPFGADRERQLLVTLHEKLWQALKPPKLWDFFAILPPELALMICAYLDMRDRAMCLKVSKRWKDVLESSGSLWTTLDTTCVRKPVTMKSLLAHLKRSKYRLDRAVITLKAKIDAPKMGYITRTCKDLRELHIAGNGLIGDSLHSLPGVTSLQAISTSGGTEVPLRDVQAVIGACHETLLDIRCLCVKAHPVRLDNIPFRGQIAESLKSIHLKGTSDSYLNFDDLRNRIPNATSVILTNFHIRPALIDATQWKSLERLDLTDTQLVRVPKLPSSLKYLVLSENRQLNLSPNAEQPNALPLLEVFACASTALDGEALKTLTAASIKAGNLKCLTIGDRMVNPREALVKYDFPACESLEELSLASLIISDQPALDIVALYPHLKKLDISSTRITGVAVKAFVTQGLKWLKINGCDRISSDAIEWARGKDDIEIIHNLMTQRTKVRGAARFADSAFGSRF